MCNAPGMGMNHHKGFTGRRTIGALVAAMAIGGCSSDSEPTEVRVDTFNVALAGAFIPFEDARRQPLNEALANLDSDIVCLQEVWEADDKAAIEAAVRENFPHVVSFEHDLSSEVADRRSQDGSEPALPTEAPCAAHGMAFNTAVECLETNCSTGGANPQTTSSECAESNCVSAVGGLLFSPDASAAQCYACLTTSLPTESFADMRNLCTTEVGAGLAFRGQSGVMILSKHPLSNAEARVMPGTWNRRVIAAATATLPGGAELDVYCNHLTPIFNSLAFPYTGAYGDGATGAAGWAEEQHLQARRLVDYVEGRSGDQPAVILGDMNAGRASGSEVVAEGVPTMDILEGAFTLAVPGDFTPSCTHCPDNPIVSEETPPVWIDHIFVDNLGPNAIVSASRTFTENSVTVDGMQIPLSDHYGLQSTILVP